MRKQIGYIGLGKMGSAMVSRLKKRGWRVATYDINETGSSDSIEELVAAVEKPRIIWIMVPAGKPVDKILFRDSGLVVFLEKGDTVVDGGNSFYEDSVRRGEKIQNIGVSFLDVGVSGGPETVREGKPALMIGGDKRIFEILKPLWADLTKSENIGYMGKLGAGHFVKMVHNGIEYGMMQAIGEGFELIKRSPFKISLREVARVYNNGSVIQSRLTDWLEKGLELYGEDLKKVSSSVVQTTHTGAGKWTMETAEKFGAPMPVMKAAFTFRVQSARKPSYTGKILSLLRQMFGGHSIK